MRKPPQPVHSLSIAKTRTRLHVATHGNWAPRGPRLSFVRDLGAAGGPRDAARKSTAARQPLPQLWVNNPSYGKIAKPL